MTEAKITETETPETETPEEHVENPAAVLKKNRELLADMAKMRERMAAIEELGRAVAGDDAVVDPKAFLAKRTADTQASEHRAQVVTQAALLKIANEGRTLPKGGAEEVIKAVLADPGVTVDADGEVVGLDAALSIAPKKSAPVPWSPPVRGYGETAPTTSYEELQAKGTAAVQAFAERSPDLYKSLRADFEKKLAKGTSLR